MNVVSKFVGRDRLQLSRFLVGTHQRYLTADGNFTQPQSGLASTTEAELSW